MAKIAFYLDTRRIRSADVRDVNAGNPGIGGTEYMFFLVAAYLASVHEVSMYVTAPGKYPPGVRYVIVRDLRHAAIAMWSAAEDILILRENEVAPHEALLNSMRQRIIVWAHNFSRPETLEACARCPNVARYLCVSRVQHEGLRGEELFPKSDYIFNAVVTRTYPAELRPPAENNVFYMGSLVKAKGFHVLARYWPDIVKAVPTAKLHVVGSGRLYDENAVLGPLGLASPEYERQFADYVTVRGRLREDVVFHGVLGADKWQLLREAKVAVTNPTGVGETFCIAAVEFGLLGVPVVTRRFGGPIDVIENGVSGILVDDERELPGAVVGLLNDEQRRRDMGRNAMALVRARFDIEVAIGRWQQVLREVLVTTPVAAGGSLTVPEAREPGRVGRPRPATATGVATVLLRQYLRYFPIDAGKPWLWSRILDERLAWRVDWPPKVAATRFGFRMEVRLPDVVENVIYLTGQWEPFLSRYLRSVLAAGDTVVDVGAGLGYYSLLASRIVGDGGQVYAFEGSPVLFARLQRNVRLNGASNVRAITAADNEAAASAPAGTLLGTVPQERLLSARLIKVDVANAEQTVLQPLFPSLPEFSSDTVWAIRMLPTAASGAQGEADRIFEAFLSRGYTAHAAADTYSPRGFLAKPRSVHLRRLTQPPDCSTDVIFLKPGRGRAGR